MDVSLMSMAKAVACGEKKNIATANHASEEGKSTYQARFSWI